MIVSFSVSNFRSFSSEETFSLVASNRLSGRHEEHAVPVPNSSERVLRTAVLYGANGAGKSNLFKALRYMKSVALEPRPKNSGTGRDAFRFAGETNEPSVFDLQFIAQEKLYRFGFKIDDHRIREEWLVRIEGGREKTLYDRQIDEHGNAVIDALGLIGEKVQALAVVGGPQNQSFLATIQANLEVPNYGESIAAILNWFNIGLRLIAPDESLDSLGLLLTRNTDLLGFVDDFLKSSSTGVDHLEVRKDEISPDQMTQLAKERAPSKGIETLMETEEGTAVVRLGDGNVLFADHLDGRLYRVRIQAAHEHKAGNIIPLEFTEESDGTRRLLHLIPALHALHKGGSVYFIDEIDRSLHPMLARNFLESFLKSADGSQSQLIMTTHESNLLDQDLLRRDEIWFAEKDQAGVTHLYSLMDFKIRNDLEIRKHYLQGRFGAVPFLGDPARLPVEIDQPA
jgi:AAA15 family ATPase/GTPase